MQKTLYENLATRLFVIPDNPFRIIYLNEFLNFGKKSRGLSMVYKFITNINL